MLEFLKRAGLRLALILFVPCLFAAWLLAAPYAMLEWQARRDHLRDLRDLTSRESWLGMWDALKSGTTR